MANKRFYWLKLKEDFFRQKEIKKLRRIAGGDTFTIIYLKMLLMSLKNDGRLYYDGIEDDFVSELALDIDEDDYNVKMTVGYLLSSGILVQNNSDEFEILTAKEMTGSECESAQRVRRMRAKTDVKALQSNIVTLQSNNDVTSCNTEKREKRKDIEKEEEKELICADAQIQPTAKPKKQKPEKHKYGSFSNVLLTDDEYSKLKEQFSDADERIENLSFGIASKGYQYKNHYATILAWARNDNKRAIQQQKKQSSFIDYAEIGRQMDLERMRANEVVTV